MKSKTPRVIFRPTISALTAIKALSEKLQTTRNSFNPPKKFSFKARKTAPTAGPNQSLKSSAQIDTAAQPSQGLPQRGDKKLHEAEEDVADHIPDGPGVQRPSLSHATKVTITKHTGLHLKLPLTASHATSSGTISNLQRCVIDLSAPTASAPFSALYLKNIKDSLVICGQTAGAVHITGVENSVLVISCRQFRMHGSKKVDVNLHSASRPIIEDCVGIRFAPMPPALSSLATAQAVNHWDQIDDFKWLKAEASPNFSLLNESRRIREEVWKEVLESEDLEEVLRVVGIR
ncbi:tubulin binding cofactor C-domain-containing protein [Ampelomyces quisqualis]|uniref:Tubulin binding cofactor C-domain-containing protein n=1 Tax=Ampelomyces quisqualis TaxID=50730 RepID=A0A6A5R1E5_AMPQU|nr:tubulin binding cofactor C-domain-containing protein [Ampelomyces quisqualis]